MKMYWPVTAFCLACVVLRFLFPPSDVQPGHSVEDVASAAREASEAQGKLLVMRIFATTTAYREDSAALKTTAQVGYVHDGSADIVVDLTKAKFKFQETGTATNLIIEVPRPVLDCSTVGIDPSKLRRVKAIPRTSARSAAVFSELEEQCKEIIRKRQYETFSSVDMIEDAKIQALRVLKSFYLACVSDKVNVDVSFFDEENLGSGNPDMKPPVKVTR